MPTLTLKPNGYTGASGLTQNTSYPWTNGYNLSTNTTTYARIAAAKNKTGEIYYTFDMSGLPENAVIRSVTCTVRARTSTTTSRYISTYSAEVCDGTTSKGTSVSFLSTTSSAKALNAGTWDATSIRNLRVKLNLKTGSSGSIYYYGYFYGATLTIEYEIPVVPPVITVATPDKRTISDETGFTRCTCTFQSDLDLSQWEARATKAGTTPARGVGLLVESGGALSANTNATVYVDWIELTDGDGEYTITVYGCSTGGVWSS